MFSGCSLVCSINFHYLNFISNVVDDVLSQQPVVDLLGDLDQDQVEVGWPPCTSSQPSRTASECLVHNGRTRETKT